MPRPRVRLVHLLILAIVIAAAARAILHSPPTHGDLLEAGTGQPAPPPATPAPGSPLAAVERAFRDGEYAAAETALSALIDAAPAGDGAAERLLLARVLLADGQPDRALDVLERLMSRYPGTPESERGRFFQAEAWETEGDHRRAVDAYRAFAARNRDVAPYVRLRVADSLIRDGRPAEARRELQSVAGEPLPLRTIVHALEELRALQDESGDRAGYLETTERLLALATLPAYRVELTYQRAAARTGKGATASAEADYLQIVTGSPESPYALLALKALRAEGQTGVLPAEQIGLVYLDAGDYAQAIAAFSEALAANPASDLAWYSRALARFRSGDYATAEAEFEAMAQRFPTSPHTPEGLAAAARSLEVDGDLDRARALYQQILSDHPMAPEADDARFRSGLIDYLQGKLPDAERSWESGTDSRAAYWLGKLRQQAGDDAGARSWWEAAERRGPDDYYGLRARAALDGRGDPTTPRDLDPASLGPPADTAEIGAWFAAAGEDFDTARLALESSPGYRRAVTLLDLDLPEQAGWEIDALADASNEDAPRVAMLACLLQARGQAALALPIGRQAVAVARAHGLPVVPALGRLANPIPYPDLVLEQGRAQAIDPLLLVALMQQESSFNRLARSPAGALGLTQVMPATGAELASRLGIEDWRPEDLLRPSVSIEMGAVFLADRLRQYDGQIAPALAAYNAGGGAVAGWLDQPGMDDPDVFVERIPYPETYEYVQIVYSNYLRYVEFYGR